MTEQEKRDEANRQADRLMVMLDLALQAVREGRGDDAVMIMQEADKTAKKIPQKGSAS
jgi:hypothetical protein